ncbi:MAG TPA: hypothetical protein VGB92_01845 [Longimicrobium sp.]
MASELETDDDAVLADTLDVLLRVTHKALDTLVPTDRNFLVSISPYGPIVAFPDDDTTRIQRFLAAVAAHSLRDKRFIESGMSLIGAVAEGILQEVQIFGGRNFEGRPAIAVSRLIAQTDPGALALHQTAKSYWPMAEIATGDVRQVPGKHFNETYTAVMIPSYFGSPLKGNLSATSYLTSSPRSPRFLRRRCRALPSASEELRQLCKNLLTERPSAEQRADALRVIANFQDSFSACMGKAIYLESIGSIEQVLETLDTVKFTGIQECSRRLLRALALDKLDRCKEALEDITYVLMNAPPSSELIVAAQLNAAVCQEKLERFSLVNAERFLEDDAFTFSTGEKLWTKALSLELIVCRRTGKYFGRKDLVEKALKEEYPDSPKGFVKTLLNWHALTNDPLSEEHLAQILTLESSMTVTARAGILGQLARSLPPGPQAIYSGLPPLAPLPNGVDSSSEPRLRTPAPCADMARKPSGTRMTCSPFHE